MADEVDPFDDIENFRLPEGEFSLDAFKSKPRGDAGKSAPPWLADKIAAGKAKGGTKKRKRDEDWFVQVYIKAVIAGAKAARDRRWVVWIYVHYRVGRKNSNTVEVGSKTLREWGVSPQTKLRALRYYEKAGLWSVEWRDGQSPMVTVRPDLCKLRGGQ